MRLYGQEKEQIRTRPDRVLTILLLDDNNHFNENLIENALSSILITWVRWVVRVNFTRLNPSMNELTKYNPDIVIIDQKTCLKDPGSGKVYTGEQMIPVIQKLFSKVKIYLMAGDNISSDKQHGNPEYSKKSAETDGIIHRYDDLREKFQEILELK